MASTTPKGSLPPMSGDKEMWRRIFQTQLQQFNKGNLQCTGTVTLTPEQNATTVLDARAGVTSFIGFMPLTPNAAVEKPLLIVELQGSGIFIVGHTNNAVDDRTYTYCIMG